LNMLPSFFLLSRISVIARFCEAIFAPATPEVRNEFRAM